MLWFEMRSWASLANSWKQKASRKRRQMSRDARLLGTVSERLEDRQFLSAVAVVQNVPDADDVPAIPLQLCPEDSAEVPTDAEVTTMALPAQSRKRGFNLSGTWDIDTSVGTLHLTTKQRGKRIRGTLDANDLDVAELLNSPIPIPIPVDMPPVKFKGTFKKGVLNLNFETEIPLPISAIPSPKVTGTVTAQVNFATGIAGHVTMNVNGLQVLSQDFTSPLPSLG